MKKIKLFTIFILLSVIFFSCSESEEPLTLVGRWELNIQRQYENNKLSSTSNYDNDDGIFIIFKDDGTLDYYEDGVIDCDDGKFGSKKMDSKPQKITVCDEDCLLTIKSNNLIIISLDYGNGEREENELKRL